ncbi:Mov34/MPN/PAD-1 domain-containing protein, putative [Eimeria praecox]|uniref:COP9 signalosome complex subunit 5 n=1 Tax=Eimeria praecox TaxID=51316 RepID=U6GHB5_9EIME|nr:Mov34/MPN/PAD-1 domain-containing protein, putative [Eimeria praecox]
MDCLSISPVDNALYTFDEEAHSHLLHSLQQHHQRLRLNPQCCRVQSPVVFTDVWVSDLALTKMMAHAESGGKIEVMGLLLGKAVVTPLPVPVGEATVSTHFESVSSLSEIDREAEGQQEAQRGYFVVTDCIALPVEGTETRVNAAEEANEFMIQYLEAAEKVPMQQKVVGWYHSHPNYGCWLSGIDVRTQQLQQQHQDPFLAIVVDPIRTISNRSIELGGFRTFMPGEAKREDEGDAEAASSQLLPAEKVNDFGAQWKQASWPQLIAGQSLHRNRSLELRRLEAIVESCNNAISAAERSQPLSLGGSSGHEVREQPDLGDGAFTAESSEDSELGASKGKGLCDKLVGTAEKAADIAVRALGGLVEVAALPSGNPKETANTAEVSIDAPQYSLMMSTCGFPYRVPSTAITLHGASESLPLANNMIHLVRASNLKDSIIMWGKYAYACSIVLNAEVYTGSMQLYVHERVSQCVAHPQYTVHSQCAFPII